MLKQRFLGDSGALEETLPEKLEAKLQHHRQMLQEEETFKPVHASPFKATQVCDTQEIEENTVDDSESCSTTLGGRRRPKKRQPWGRLVALDAEQLTHVNLFPPQVFIGRRADCQVILSDIRISGHHCTLYRVEGDGDRPPVVALHDTSTNGTYVNGTRVALSDKRRALGMSKQEGLVPPNRSVGGAQTPLMPVVDGRVLTPEDGVRLLNHGDRVALAKPVSTSDTAFCYLFEDLTGGWTARELRCSALQQMYDVGDVIGTGAFSQVRVCIHRRTAVQRCVKIIDTRKYGTKPAEGDTEHIPPQLAREISILRQVQHDNIVNVVDVFKSARYLYLVLDLARGGELFERLYDEGALGETRARTIFTQLLRAVQYLHAHDIVHRDIKPENILFSDTTSDTVKITDFGLARLVGAQRMQTLCGTPAYVAPEIIRALQQREAEPGAPDLGYDKAVDMWSLGTVLYALLSGAPAFQEYDDELDFDADPNVVQRRRHEHLSLFEQITGGVFTMPAELFGGVSSYAQDLVRRLLVVDPKARLTVEQALAHPWIVGDGTTGFASPRPKVKRDTQSDVTPSSPPPKNAKENLGNGPPRVLVPETPEAKRDVPVEHRTHTDSPVFCTPAHAHPESRLPSSVTTQSAPPGQESALRGKRTRVVQVDESPLGIVESPLIQLPSRQRLDDVDDTVQKLTFE